MIENLPNEVIRCAFWFYKRFTASSRFENLVCDIIVDRLQQTYNINFLKAGEIILTLTINSDDIRYCSFESIINKIETQFKTKIMNEFEQIIFDYLNENRLWTQYDDLTDIDSTVDHAKEIAKMAKDFYVENHHDSCECQNCLDAHAHYLDQMSRI